MHGQQGQKKAEYILRRGLEREREGCSVLHLDQKATLSLSSFKTILNEKMGEKCCFCQKIGNSLLKCSACGCVSYCNQNCQKSDWKKHKKNCCSYKLVEVPGKDFGLVAVRNIKQGEALMKESPLLIQSKNVTEMKKGPSLLEQFENLSKSNQT